MTTPPASDQEGGTHDALESSHTTAEPLGGTDPDQLRDQAEGTYAVNWPPAQALLAANNATFQEGGHKAEEVKDAAENAQQPSNLTNLENDQLEEAQQERDELLDSATGEQSQQAEIQPASIPSAQEGVLTWEGRVLEPENGSTTDAAGEVQHIAADEAQPVALDNDSPSDDGFGDFEDAPSSEVPFDAPDHHLGSQPLNKHCKPGWWRCPMGWCFPALFDRIDPLIKYQQCDAGKSATGDASTGELPAGFTGGEMAGSSSEQAQAEFAHHDAQAKVNSKADLCNDIDLFSASRDHFCDEVHTLLKLALQGLCLHNAHGITQRRVRARSILMVPGLTFTHGLVCR